VTHDQEEALTMSDVIVVMRDGRIQQQGAPEVLYERPVNRFVAGFIGSTNTADATVVGHDVAAGTAVVETAAGLRTTGIVTDREARLAAGDAVTLAIRPERLRVLDPGAGSGDGGIAVSGRVQQGTYLGDQTEYRIATEAIGEVIARRQNEIGGVGQRVFGPGEAVTVAWQQEANLVLAS
jgi:ABC-type Fe3+/spermidine/putrescine transport system ATPase subunit